MSGFKKIKRLVKVYAKYQLYLADQTYKKGDFRWKTKPFKRVTLVNPKECESRVNISMLIELWSGTGHVAWQILLANWFIMAMLSALEENEKEANITEMFDKDLFNKTGDLMFPQSEIHEQILPAFEIVSETEKELKLKFKVN